MTRPIDTILSEPAVALATFVRPAWRLHALIEVGNFVCLRRYLGCRRADALVEDVANRLRLAVPQARLRAAGRNLLELEAEAAGQDTLAAMIAAAHATFEEPLDLDGELHRITLLIGSAIEAAHCDDVLLVEQAEEALGAARAVDRASGDVSAAQPQAARLADEIGRAIDAEEFVLFYQPKIHARRQEIASVEALIRWEHPERGLVLPGDFITAAEDAHLIDRLTLWTIERAIADGRTLRDAGYDLRVFVNISGQLLSDPVFVAQACRLVAEADASIGFEVTETSVIRDPQSAIANLQRFADIGIRVAIDDYGAGLSSLAYLKQLPARELKIDKLFVTQLTSSNRDPLIVRSTIDLAHALDMEVVAEGVETHAALALLTVMGCDMIQGYLISRPVALNGLIAFLREDRHRSASQETRATFKSLATTWKRG